MCLKSPNNKGRSWQIVGSNVLYYQFGYLFLQHTVIWSVCMVYGKWSVCSAVKYKVVYVVSFSRSKFNTEGHFQFLQLDHECVNKYLQMTTWPNVFRHDWFIVQMSLIRIIKCLQLNSSGMIWTLKPCLINTYTIWLPRSVQLQLRSVKHWSMLKCSLILKLKITYYD